jgi:hypothetical protein
MPNYPETIARLEAALARAEAATPGPWTWADWSLDNGPNEFTLQAPPEARPGGPDKTFPTLGVFILTDEEHHISRVDRSFIAAARTEHPAMLWALLEIARRHWPYIGSDGDFWCHDCVGRYHEGQGDPADRRRHKNCPDFLAVATAAEAIRT